LGRSASGGGDDILWSVVPVQGVVKLGSIGNRSLKSGLIAKKHKINPYFCVRCNGLFQRSLKMLLKNLGTKQAKTPTTESFRDASDDVKQARLYLGTSPFLKP